MPLSEKRKKKKNHNNPHYPYPHLRLWGSKRITYKFPWKGVLEPRWALPLPFGPIAQGESSRSKSVSPAGETTMQSFKDCLLPQEKSSLSYPRATVMFAPGIPSP